MSSESGLQPCTLAKLGENEHRFARNLLEESIARTVLVKLYRHTHLWPDETYPVYKRAENFIAGERSNPKFDNWLRHYLAAELVQGGFDIEEGPAGQTQVARVRHKLVTPEPAPPYNQRVLTDEQREELALLTHWLDVCGNAYVAIDLEPYCPDHFEYKLSEWPTHTLYLRTGTNAEQGGFAGQETICDQLVQATLGQAPLV